MVLSSHKRLPIDDVDKRLILLLMRDVRCSNVSLGKALGISDVAVHRRIDKLKKKGILHYTVLVNPRRVGTLKEVLIALKVTENHVNSAVNILLRYPVFLRETSGSYNILVGANFTTDKEILSFLSECLGGMAGLETCDLLYLIESHMPLTFPGSINQLDVKDEAIIRLLQEDARQTAVELSRKTGIALRTVRRRLVQLFRYGIVRPYVFIQPDFHIVSGGDVFLKVNYGYISDVWDRLTKHTPAVNFACLTIGRYDIAVHVTGETAESLEYMVHHDLESLPGVTECKFFVTRKVSLRHWRGSAVYLHRKSFPK